MPRFNSKHDISREQIEKLYIQEGLSAAEIAAQLKCGETTVFRVLEFYGIPRRTKSDYRFEVSKEELERLYLVERLSEYEIADHLQTSQLTISRRLREYGIPTRPGGGIPFYTVPSELYLSWSPNLAYAIGLLASDGNLSKNRDRVEFISTDLDLIRLFLSVLNLQDVHVVTTKLPLRRAWFKAKFSDSNFRRFLEDVGLTPNKSKTIGCLNIPDEFFVDFLRGEMDGDGSWYISSAWNGRYKYLTVELVSASEIFIDWMHLKIQQMTGLEPTKRSRSLGKYHYLSLKGRKAVTFGAWLYQNTNAPCLARKRNIWEMASNKADPRSKHE